MLEYICASEALSGVRMTFYRAPDRAFSALKRDNVLNVDLFANYELKSVACTL